VINPPLLAYEDERINGKKKPFHIIEGRLLSSPSNHENVFGEKVEMNQGKKKKVLKGIERPASQRPL
jgi:hypothetical protein